MTGIRIQEQEVVSHIPARVSVLGPRNLVNDDLSHFSSDASARRFYFLFDAGYPIKYDYIQHHT